MNDETIFIRDLLLYAAEGHLFVHDDFGNLIPVTWPIAFQIYHYLLTY
jgi:hypothetical protein